MGNRPKKERRNMADTDKVQGTRKPLRQKNLGEKIIPALRIVLSLILVFFIYLETGIATALFALLVIYNAEMVSKVLRTIIYGKT